MGKEEKKKSRSPRIKASATRFHTSVYLEEKFYQEIKKTLAANGWSDDFNRLVNVLLRNWRKRPRPACWRLCSPDISN